MTQAGFFSGSLLSMLNETSRRGSETHRRFLRGRQRGLAGAQSIIDMQILGHPSGAPIIRPVLFGPEQLEEFGRGQITRCLGAGFAKYAGRRIPRIPNGDLRMMSRVVAITGQVGNFTAPASIVVEYDVPADAWYLRESAYPDIPTSLMMEIALQPCGFLSAYLDTYALVPYQEYYFRNLDGALERAAAVDARGKTITTSARLLSSVTSAGTVIQRFAFTLECDQRTIYTGESTFGYFAVETMRNQVGLDGGRRTLPSVQADPALAREVAWMDLTQFQQGSPRAPFARLARGRLHFLQQAAASRSGGRYGQGYLYASRPVDPADWFYPFHFYEDPVMPGSLGVEAVLETMQAAALAWGLGDGLRSPRFVAANGMMTWRYRGQITQQHHLVELEVHISESGRSAQGAWMKGDASLWVDGLRIYELKNAAVALVEAE